MIIFTSIRQYRKQDLSQLIEIYKSAFAEPPWNETWSSEEIIKDLNFALSQEKNIILVAEQKDKLLGFAWGYKIPLEEFPFLKGQINSSSNYLDEIAVKGDQRNKKIGLMLGRTYLNFVEKQGLKEVILRTDINNKASLGLFKKLKFEELNIFDPKYDQRRYFSKKIK